MDDPIRLLLTNAGSAFLIALLAWAASLTIRRQAVVHGLWLLALVRLVTPPIAPVPLMPAWPGLALVSPASTPTVVSIPSGAPEGILAVVQPAAADPIRSLAAPSAGPMLPLRSPSTALAWRGAAWLSLAAGALAITLLTAWRFSRFGRLLASAQPAPDAVAERTAALAARLGLRRVPPVLLVPARIPPMLWPHRGGARLLLPTGLLPDLHVDELDTLLAHELAHVRRRDHWVRLVEIAATALFWWYPVAWWARRALRRAEERCCDEWVLRLLPRSAEAYANGLLKSLTFVAQTTDALPSLASGAGPVEDIEARLKEILMTRPVPRLAAPIRLTLAAAAALGLAVFPTHAQSSATKADPVAPDATATPTSAAAPTAAPDPSPQVQPVPAPEPALAGHTRTSDPARRALEAQRRALEDQRRQLQRQKLALQRQQLELEAQEREKKQQAIEAEVMEAEKQMRVLAFEDQVRAMRDATDELTRSLAEQIESLKHAAAEAPGQKTAVEHEIQRLQAALAALRSGGTPKSSPRSTPRPQP